ncbi:MAG: rhodanese-like domain-containing protein [Arcobacteraceae bacterium]
MKPFRNLVVSAILLGSTTVISADVIQEFNSKSPKTIVEFAQKNKLEIVGYDYVKKATANGTRNNASAVIIDARPQKLYDAGHIATALSLPDTQFDKMYADVLGKLDKSKEVILYCGGFKCEKSHELAVMLKNKGHKNIKVYAAGMPDWSAKSYDEVSQNTAKAFFDSKNALFIDTRPFAKYAGGTIIGSLNIPDTQMDKYMGWFPNDKETVIIPYCGGYECEKSHEVGDKLIANGYKNVKVYAGGYPEWSKSGLPTTAGGSVAVSESKPKEAPKQVGFLKPGMDVGSVDGEWFKSTLSTLPANVVLIDVRDKASYDNGHIKGAINIYAAKMKPEEFGKLLPKDKEIVFYCATGTRAIEAREFAKEAKIPNIDTALYLDANITCDKNNECKIEVNEPLGF